MAVEAKRGCGYRKVGGLYLVGSGGGVPCDRLPILLHTCPTCSQGIKQARGWTWVDLPKLVGGNHRVGDHPVVQAYDSWCGCFAGCPLCHNVQAIGRAGLVWIGTAFYKTPEVFEHEARTQGISRRIASLPRGFELGKTWVLFAHPKAIYVREQLGDGGEVLEESKHLPAIIKVWRPTAVERIYKESDRDNDAVQADEKRGITPVYVPDDDPDHQGTVYDKPEEE
jgi:hypothetical protein